MDNGFKTYTVRYHHDGAEWGLEIPARNYQDARARLSKLACATVDGEVEFVAPAAIGPFVPVYTTLRNAIARIFPSNEAN